jgi:hypothetical protein
LIISSSSSVPEDNSTLDLFNSLASFARITQVKAQFSQLTKIQFSISRRITHLTFCPSLITGTLNWLCVVAFFAIKIKR